jgi:hypothetical protein
MLRSCDAEKARGRLQSSLPSGEKVAVKLEGPESDTGAFKVVVLDEAGSEVCSYRICREDFDDYVDDRTNTSEERRLLREIARARREKLR